MFAFRSQFRESVRLFCWKKVFDKNRIFGINVANEFLT